VRAAPAVCVRCTGGPLWRVWCALLPVLTMAVVATWVVGHAGPIGVEVWSGVLVAGSLLAGLRLRRQPPAVVLAWDGRCWTVDGRAGQLAVMIDTGPWMLLRLRVDGQASTQWVAVSAREAGPAWHLLRTAVFVQPPQTLEADPAGARGTGRG
jgi:hypothetical protein